MDKVFMCGIFLLNGGLVYSQLLSTARDKFMSLFLNTAHPREFWRPYSPPGTQHHLLPNSYVRNVRLVNHVPYILEVMETATKDIEEYGWCNLKIPNFEVDIDEDVFNWHVKGKVTFQNAFVTSIQKVDVIQHTVQQVWRFDNSDNTTSVLAQATLRMVEVALGYDVHVVLEDGSNHYFTGIFKHDTAEFPFTVIYNMFTEEFSASVTMNTLPQSTNKMVFAPATALTQVLSHSYDVTSAAAGMAAWGPEVFEPILLNVATTKVTFPEICFNCPA